MKPSITIGHLPILDHLVLGVFEKNDGKFTRTAEFRSQCFTNWNEEAAALTKGTLDGAFLLFPLALDLFRRGEKLRLVLLGHREGQVIIAKNSIHGIEELKGKTVLIPHRYSTHHILLYQALHSVGLSMEDITLKVGYETPYDVNRQFKEGLFDAYIIAEPIGAEAEAQGIGHILKLSKEIKEHHIDCVLVLREEVITNHHESCAELVTGLVKAGMFINAYPRQAAEIGESFLGWPEKLLIRALSHDNARISFWDLLPRLEDFEELECIAILKLGLWNTEIPLTGFVDSSFAQEAYREWVIDTRKETKDKGEERTLPKGFKDAAQRMGRFWNTSIPMVGVRFIRPGEKYPKELAREELDDLLGQAFFEDLFGGRECVISVMTASKKAIAFTLPYRDIEPDRVLMRLTKTQALKVATALSLGSIPQKNQLLREEVLQKDLLETNEEIIMLQHKDEVWCSFGFKTFRLLPLLLSLYER